MKFLKLLLVGILSTLFLVFGSGKIYAENEFSVDANVTYDVQNTGKTIVYHNVTLENNTTNLYATNYTLSLENIEISNVKATDDKNNILPVEILRDGKNANIKITFSDASVGKGAKRNFTISYENTEFAIRTGEIWEVSIPKLGEGTNFKNYQLTLKIPKDFGLEAYISPKPDSSQLVDSGYIYTYSSDKIAKTGVTAGYGQFQVFAFNLSYHLENPISRSSTTQITLPPDTSFQKVYIQKIDPKPTNVTVDPDGNWIAIYDLSPRQRVDVVVSGTVQIFASYRSFTKPTDQELNDNLTATSYWQSDDPRIKALADKLKTPKAIYDYVSENLHYDPNRVQPNVQRMGAIAALENPTQAICMEFTDLFIAIARAAGIPAREVEGYAYTENPDIEPLGLVADVLHSWPEYYDKEKGVWIPVDPTWGSTTAGIDYFSKLDLRHFAFVIHGADDTKPYPAGSYKLGSNPQKDVYVSFGQLPENKISIPAVAIKPFRVLPFISSLYTVTVTNPGPAALYSIYPTIYYDSNLKTQELIHVLPPYSNQNIEIALPYSFLGKETPNVIRVSVNSSDAQIMTNKKQIVIDSLIVVLVLITILTVFVLIKVKKIKISSFFAKILSSKKKNDEKSIGQTPQDKTIS